MAFNLFLYLSEILGKKIVDSNYRSVGYLMDICMHIGEEIYPKAESFVVKRGYVNRKFARISMADVADINDVIQLKITRDKIKYDKQLARSEFSLCRDILDQQIVDTSDKKVVRVNDVHMLRADKNLYLAHMDVGLRGIVRRLGWINAVDHIVRLISPQATYLKREDLISWKNTHVLTIGRVKNVLRLGVERDKLSQMHPADLAEIMEDLDVFDRRLLFKTLGVEMQRKVFADIPAHEKVELIEKLDIKEAVDLLENIPADEATDLLHKLKRDKTRRLLKQMQTKSSKKLTKLLGFDQKSAGGLMTTEYLSLHKDALVKDAIKKIKDNVDYPGNLINIYLIDDDNHLVGATSLRQFINADPDKPLADIISAHPICVSVDDGIEQVAVLLEKYKFSSIPVVTADNILQGVITTDDVLEELISIAWRKYKDEL